MKAVMLSIQPKWCELIASGKKTVEVRKTKPKLEMPFKVYIYCTMPNPKTDHSWQNKPNLYVKGGKVKWIDGAFENTTFWNYAHQRVIGEFVCDHIYGIINFLPYESEDNHHTIFPCVLEQTCLTDDEIDEYLGQRDGFGWHITDLVIYDKPKELREFYQKCKSYDKDEWENDDCLECENPCGNGGKLYLKRPPQSWYYVEERSGE